MSTQNAPEPTFSDIGISGNVDAVLQKKQIINPTPIQRQAIPPALKGSDCIGIAQTGTGKTLAFALPVIQQMLENGGRTLVLAPTRELAQQIEETFSWFRKSMKINSTVVVGGASMGRQIQELRRKPNVIVATPGRLIDHLQQRNINLDGIQYVVFDEADRMFDMGFAPQLREIFGYLPKKDQRQTLLFSATMPDAIAELVQQHMQEPVRIEIARAGTAAKNVDQEIIIIDREHRKNALLELLETSDDGATLVFTRTKHQAKNLTKWLRQQDFKAEEIHGNRSQGQRQRAIKAMTTGRSKILVATDIAARGIDIEHISLVVNFELPDQAEDYVHRIGRTGRAQREGRAVSIVLSDQKGEIQEIQKLINKQIEVTDLDTVPTAELRHGAGRKKRGGGGRGRRGGGRGGYGRSRSGGGRSGGGRSYGGNRSRSGGGRSRSGGSRNGGSRNGGSRGGGNSRGGRN
jgi:ATP-dependent RNA helicase RhlE